MKKFSSLLVYELRRVKGPYSILLGVVAILQLGAVFLVNRSYMSRMEEFIRGLLGDRLRFLEEAGPLTFRHVTVDQFYILSLAIALFALLVYAFAIWYRDWRGSDSFSARLLMLPETRTSIYFAKLAAILFLIGGLLVLQILLLYAEEWLLAMLTPDDLYAAFPLSEVLQTHPFFMLVLPPLPLDFILHYTLGIGMLALFHFMILMNLSWKWKGLLVDLLLAAGVVGIWALIIWAARMNWLFPHELLAVLMLFGILLFLTATYASCRVLVRKINY